MKFKRSSNPYRAVKERSGDFKELQTPLVASERVEQAARCMNCGVPFCLSGMFYGGSRAVSGCPNNNLIPEWNDLLFRGEFKFAFERLVKTNYLPEMTGRVCPAPCEKACVNNLNSDGVSIHDNERFIIDKAFEEGWVRDTGLPAKRSGRRVAVVGSGPAGLSAAWRLNQLGHNVVVFEKSDDFGGLLMYGIPNMKLEKEVIERRIKVMREVGIEFVANCEIGVDKTIKDLKKDFDRVLLTNGAGVPRDIHAEGRSLAGIEFAVPFLTEITKLVKKSKSKKLAKSLEGKKVVVIGGGDTGNDCIGTAVRLGASSVRQYEIAPKPPVEPTTVWPEYPNNLMLGYGQLEAIEAYGDADFTEYGKTVTEFVGSDGALTHVKIACVGPDFKVISGTEETVEADLVLIAAGFVGVEKELLESCSVQNYTNAHHGEKFNTDNEFIFIAGDARRGPSLVIWAIREGRLAAEEIDYALNIK
jgi:glutamate synthase (NADPH/NADH) small chain